MIPLLVSLALVAPVHDAHADSSVAMSASLANPPVCRSDGRRFVTVYAHPDTQAPRPVADELRGYVAMANGKLVDEALKAGVERELFFDCDGDQPAVYEVATKGSDPDAVITEVQEKLAPRLGFTDPHAYTGEQTVKFLIFFDGVGYRDVGYGWFDGSDTSDNYITSALVYRPSWGTYNVLHEVMHTLGAVPFNAPHSTGGGHCWDGSDVMCYRSSDPSGHLYTDSVCPELRLDCGNDDYFPTDNPFYTAPQPEENTMGLVRKMRRAGVKSPRMVRREAKDAGLKLNVALALLQMETGDRNASPLDSNFQLNQRNIFGCDWGPGIAFCHEKVTEDRVKALLDGGKENGVGWTQLTSFELVRRAKRAGGAHLPRYQCRVGFRHLARLIREEGSVLGGFRRYNGSWTYAYVAVEKAQDWDERLA